jgi:tetratricopeptide (TPR) repeat protein
VAAQATDVRVLRGQARELDGGLAYAPLVDALTTLRGDPRAESLLRGLYDAIDQAALGRPGAAPAVLAAQLLESLPGSTLIAIDDLHLADADTLSLLATLPRRVPGLAILGTARRPPALDIDLAVQLQPLSVREVADLVTALLGRTPSDSTIRRIHAPSRGHPWFVQECVLTLVQGGAVRCADPDARRGAILGRLFQRDQGGRDLARVLAAFSRTRESADLAALAELTGVSVRDAERAFDGLLRDGIVARVGDGYAMAHPIVAEALYADLGIADRRRVHTRIGELLRKEGLTGNRRVLEWATHVAEGGSPEALPAMLRAAELTRWTAPLSAAHWYGRAAEIAENKGELLARQSVSYWKGSRPTLALECGQRALATLSAGRRRTRTAYTVVGAAHAMGWYDVALTIGTQQEPQADDPTALLAQRALIRAELGHPSDDLSLRAWNGLYDCPPEDRVITAGCLALRALIQGEWAETQRAVEDLLAFAAALPPGARLASLESAAHVMSIAGLRSRATNLLEQAEQIHRGLGWHDIAGHHVRTMAVVRRLGGEWGQALADIAKAAGALAEAGLLENLALLHNIELDILLDQGKYDAAARILAETPPEGALQEGLRSVSRARVALGRGNHSTARNALDQALTSGVPDVVHRALAVQVLLHASTGDLEAGRTAAARLAELTATGTPRALLSADLAMAWAFHDRTRAGAALERARADGLPFEEARARLILGTLGDPAKLPRAYAIFPRLGAEPWRTVAQRRLRAARLVTAQVGDLTPA